MKQIFRNLATVPLLLVGASAIQAGGMDSGGADYIEKSAGAMFFQESGRTIYTCLHWEDPFPISSKDATTIVYQTYFQWKQYLNERAKDATYEVQVNNDPNDFIYPKLYTNNLMIREAYDGQCEEDEDFQIYLGRRTKQVREELRTKRLNNPAAFTTVTSRSENFLWSKGYAWFAHEGSVDIGDDEVRYPSWDEDSFYGTMLREWGRVLGIKGTVEGTIMREEFAYYLHPSRDQFPNGGSKVGFFRNIDHENQVLGNFEAIQSGPSRAAIFEESSQRGRAFGRMLMGRAVHGRFAESRLQIRRRPYPGGPGTSHNEYLEGSISFKDQKSTEYAKLKLLGELQPRNDQSRLFYRVGGVYMQDLQDDNGRTSNIYFTSSIFNSRRVMTGTIEGKDSKTYPVVATFNFRTDPGIMISQYGDEKYRKRWAIFLLDGIHRVRIY